MKFSSLPIAALFIIILNVNHAFATQNVSSPVVDAGVSAVEVRGGWQHDSNDSFRLRQHMDHGFSDAFALRMISRQDHRSTEHWRYNSTTVEARWQFIEKDTAGWAAGMRALYEFADPATGNADEIGMRLLGLWETEALQYRLNLNVDYEVGPQRETGLKFGTRAQVTYRWKPDIRIGTELFSNYDVTNSESGWNDHRHQLGPVAKIQISENMDIQIGYLAGLTSSSPDGTTKLFLSWSW